MSERGTFITNYIYDPAVRPVLLKHLPSICRVRPDAFVVMIGGTVFAGWMHGSYCGEEAYQMEVFIDDVLVPALPELHVEFSIAVLPDDASAARVFTICNRKVAQAEMVGR